jgi:hypothetical protein
MDHVAARLPDLVRRWRLDLEARGASLDRAATTLQAWNDAPEAGNDRIREAMAAKADPSPFALALHEPPLAAFDPAPFAPVTVVAADGSSIDVDRFAAVACYVISVGEAVLPYGTNREPRLHATASLGPDDGFDGPDARGRAVTLRRDVQELRAGVVLAADSCREGPTVLLLDGTLFPWDLDSNQVTPAFRKEMEEQTRDALALASLSGPELAMGAYVSGSRAADVVTSLAGLAGDRTTSWPVADGALFARLLADGQRSALFASETLREHSVERRFAPLHSTRFFYLRSGDDIARVELPRWAAAPERLGRLHATLVDQCRRCDGYPRALQEAHELAVISAADRLQFSRMLEQEAARQGLRTPANGKDMSKRRRAV